MKQAVLIIIFLSFFVFNSYGFDSSVNTKNTNSSDNLSLPNITQADIELTKIHHEKLRSELLEYDLKSLDEEGDFGRGFNASHLLDYLIALVNKRVYPEHLKNFDAQILTRNSEKDVFLNYKGISGGCYQFRLFHKHKDEFVDNSKWSSSILTIPSKRLSKNGTGPSVVLAPTIQGPSMFIEGGIWSQLCERGVASLMPESIYKQKQSGDWDKLIFDPTPNIESALDFSLYEKSIKRYERLLNKNLSFLKNFNTLKTDYDLLLKDLPVMNLISDQVGLWGSSFGAIVGSVVVGKNPSIKGAVFTVGGGNLPFVVSVSEIDLFKSTREEQMKSLSIQSVKLYEQYISQYLPTDPLNYFTDSDKNRVYMIIAEKDTTVPTQAQFELYEKIGKPKSSFLKAGHVLTLVYTAWLGKGTTEKALDFLVEKLSH